jgi:hypothetical protein
LPAIVRTAAGQAGNCAFDRTHTGEIALAIWARVVISPGVFADWKREVVATLLVGDSEIAARSTPFISVGENSATACAELGENVRQFVAQRTINFRWVVEQTRIQQNQSLAIISATGGRFETGIPFEAKLVRKARRAE